jgi:small-conductance mechanosensitive channel
MHSVELFILHHPTQLLVPLLVLAITLVIGRVVKGFVFRFLRRWADRRQSPAAVMITQALRGPFMIWVLMLGIHLATQSADIPASWQTNIARILSVLWIVSLALTASRLVGDIIRHYGSDVPGALPVTTLTQNLAQIGVGILALMILLNSLNIQITAILTALGVGGLAVALALQDTLSNLFAGFYVAIARQVRLNDYIKLNTGEEGYVNDITWRSTMIRTLANNLIIIPNAKLAQAIVTNYCLPEKRVSVSVQIGVDYSSDIELVERVLLEEATAAIGAVAGLLADPAPSVGFDPGFGDSSLGFTLGFSVAEFADQFRVRNELRRRILRRFRKEGIDMPFPTRTLYVKETRAE